MSGLWYDPAVIARNLRAIQHELETPARDHDADGACCRAALADPETETDRSGEV